MSWEGISLEQIHGELTGELQRSYDLYSQVVTARYGAETISPEGLRTEHEESKLWRQFVLDSVALLPKTRSGSFYIPTDQKLLTQQIIESTVRTESRSGYSNATHLDYLIGIDEHKVYMASPQDEMYYEDWPEDNETWGPKPRPNITEPKLYSLTYSRFDGGLVDSLSGAFRQLVSEDGKRPKLTDETFRTLYYAHYDTYLLSGSTDMIPKFEHGTTEELTQYSYDKFKFFARTMTTAGIGQRLWLLAIRFGALERHQQLLDTLSDNIMELRGIDLAERERIREQAREIFGAAIMSAQAPESEPAPKRRRFAIGRSQR